MYGCVCAFYYFYLHAVNLFVMAVSVCRIVSYVAEKCGILWHHIEIFNSRALMLSQTCSA